MHGPTPIRPAHRDDRQARHDRADLLLEVLATTRDARRRAELEQEIISLTLDLADHAARRFRGRGMELDDLCQVARLALVKAVRGFRPDRGPCFAAYAVPTVTGEIKRHFRDTAWVVRPPRRLQEARLRLVQCEEQLRHELQRDPTPSELRDALGASTPELEEALAAGSGFRAASLETSAQGGPMEVPDRHDHYAEIDQRDALHRALAALNARELEILRLRFVDERTQSDIGRQIGVSQMQVSRLLSATLRRLRTSMLAADAVA